MHDLTLEDIARQAGVSRSTVSRVINNQPNVSHEVRKKVQKTIRTTGFHPNAAARSLASQRSWMLGLVLPRNTSSFFTDPYFPYLTQGIALACNNHNYTLSLFLVDNEEDEKKISPRISRRGLLDGILLQSGQAGDKMLELLTRSSVPLVVLGRPHETAGVSYIDVDNINAARQATHHLIGLGYRRIAMITGAGTSTVSSDRREGYLKAFSDVGRMPDLSMIAEGDFSENSGYLAMQKLLHLHPDAVFAQSDIMAVGAIKAVEEAGLKVPGDIAFVGFDDIPVASLSSVKLTTVRQPISRFGIKAVELLIDLIEKGTEPARRLILDTELVVRDSCGANKHLGTQGDVQS